MPFKLQSQLVQVPDSHLRLVRASRNNMVPISCRPDTIARFGELEMLDELDGAFNMFSDCTFALGFGSSLANEPVWQRRRRPGRSAIHGIDFNGIGINGHHSSACRRTENVRGKRARAWDTESRKTPKGQILVTCDVLSAAHDTRVSARARLSPSTVSKSPQKGERRYYICLLLKLTRTRYKN